jgi:hypothetical protein
MLVTFVPGVCGMVSEARVISKHTQKLTNLEAAAKIWRKRICCG